MYQIFLFKIKNYLLNFKFKYWLIYKKCQLRYLLYQTKTVESLLPNKSNSEIITLTSHDHLLMYLICIKTFSYYSKQNFFYTVVDDGSLNKSDIKLIKKFIKNVRFIPNKESKKILGPILKTKYYTNSLIQKNTMVKKHIYLPLLSMKNKILMLDSDILFYKKPLHIIKFLNDKSVDKVLFMSDYWNGYSVSKIEAKYFFKLRLISRLNGGLISYNPKETDYELIEKYLNFLSNCSYNRFINMQTILSMMFSKKNNKLLHRLPSSYYVPFNQKNKTNTICKHFISNSSVRYRFYSEASVLLKSILSEEKLLFK